MVDFPQVKRHHIVDEEVSPPIAVSTDVEKPVIAENPQFPAPYKVDTPISPQPTSRLKTNLQLAMAMLGWMVFVTSLVAFLNGSFNIRVPFAGGSIGFKKPPIVVASSPPTPKPPLVIADSESFI